MGGNPLLSCPNSKRLEKAFGELEETNTALEDTNVKLEHLATTDALTGLSNRHSMEDSFLREIARCEKDGHPVSLITKSTMVLRDLDLLAEMGNRNLCSVAMSVTTLDDELKRRLEPRTASPNARLRAIKELASAGVRVDLMVAPVIPSINDHEIEDILAAGKEAGATAANYIFLRLPLEIGPLFRDWLQQHYPDRASHVMSIVQQSRGGKDYQPAFYTRMAAEGVFADIIGKRFRVAARKLGLTRDDRFRLDTSQFSKPIQQLSLF